VQTAGEWQVESGSGLLAFTRHAACGLTAGGVSENEWGNTKHYELAWCAFLNFEVAANV
jgi:hypothetical protein